MTKIVNQSTINLLEVALAKVEKEFESGLQSISEVKESLKKIAEMFGLAYGQGKNTPVSDGTGLDQSFPDTIPETEGKTTKKEYQQRKDPLLRVLNEGPATFKEVIGRLGIYIGKSILKTEEKSWKACLISLVKSKNSHVKSQTNEQGEAVYQLNINSEVTSIVS